jgi:hypothetical protein
MLTLATSAKSNPLQGLSGLSALPGLWAPVQAFFKAFMPAVSHSHYADSRARPAASNTASISASSASPRFLATKRELMPLVQAPSISAYQPITTTLIANNQAVTRAIRMIRMVEPGQKSTSTGRMVISGRMADVCAELDRLVAREATLH